MNDNNHLHEEIKILIIEDEEIWSKIISDELNTFGYTIAGIADNFEQAILLFNSTDYDLVLLDIHINNKNSGIQLGKMLSTLYKKPFIFITGSTHNTNEAMDVYPAAYLIKPVNSISLIIAIQNAIDRYYNKPDEPPNYANTNYESYFFVKYGNKYKKIDWKEIVYLRSEKNYTILYNSIDKTEYSIRCTLIKTMKQLIPLHLQNKFTQINRSEAVQLSFINEIIEDELKTNYGNLSITESYSKNLKNIVKIIS